MSEWFENPRDVESSNAVARRLGELWNFRFLRAEEGSPINFIGVPDATAHPPHDTVFLEVKSRNYDMDTLDRMGGILLNKKKWLAIKSLVDDSETSPIFVFVAKARDNMWAHVTTTFEYDSEMMGPRRDRDDRNSNGLCITLKKRRFQPVSSVVPWHHASITQPALL